VKRVFFSLLKAIIPPIALFPDTIGVPTIVIGITDIAEDELGLKYSNSSDFGIKASLFLKIYPSTDSSSSRD